MSSSKEYIERYKNNYPHATYEERQYFPDSVLPFSYKIHHYIASRISDNSIVCEVGSNTGGMKLLAEQLGKKNLDYHGIDIVDRFVQTSIVRGVKAVCGDAEELHKYFPENYFDIIICSETLEHVEHPELVLSGIKYIAKPNAMFLFSVPHIDGRGGRLNIAKPGSWHLRAWDKDSMCVFIQTNGFSVTEIHNVDHQAVVGSAFIWK